MASKIVAGRADDINKNSGQWLIVDIGFSSTARSCGVWDSSADEENPARAVTFAELKSIVIEEAQKAGTQPLNLLIEAPLSVAFQPNGNPTRRLSDTWTDVDGETQRRDWYVNAGAVTLIAASYLLRALHGCQRQREVRLFEGFVSFKSASTGHKSEADREKEHKRDVRLLKDAVWDDIGARRYAPEELGQEPHRRIESAFPFLDERLIPPVIRIEPQLLRATA